MTRPLRSQDAPDRAQVRPMLPPRIDARTHLQVAEAYLAMGLPEEAMFELSLLSDDPAVRSEAERLRARIRERLAPSRLALAASDPNPPAGPATRVDGLRAKSRVVRVSPAARSVPAEVDDAIDLAFDECFCEEAPTSPDGPGVYCPTPASGTRLKSG